MKNFWTVIAAMICFSAHGEMRSWTNTTGQAVEGEYVSLVFDNVNIRKADGKQIKVPLASLSAEDRNYVELRNPPKLRVEYRESAPTRQYVADPWEDNFGGTHDNHPIFIVPGKFGAEVIQESLGDYNHEMTVEIYILTKQYYDTNKYHLIAHSKSEPFKLTKEGDRRFEYEDPRNYNILKYNLYSERPRGEILGEFLILVHDERGEIIGYNSSKKWLYNYLDKLSALPVGAWLDKNCDRAHPTSPAWGF